MRAGARTKERRGEWPARGRLLAAKGRASATRITVSADEPYGRVGTDAPVSDVGLVSKGVERTWYDAQVNADEGIVSMMAVTSLSNH